MASQLVELYGFFAVVLRGLTLTLEALTLGGIIFLFLIRSLAPQEPTVVSRCRRVLRISAAALCVTAICSSILTSLVLQATTDGFTWLDAIHTNFFRAEMLIALGAACIAILARTDLMGRFLVPAGVAVLTGGALTSHAFARIEDRSVLLVCAALHHLATAAWIGGLPYLLIAVGRSKEQYALGAARRFSKLAMIGVGVLITAGLIQAWAYVDSPAALYGTAYGVMLSAKIVLLAPLLLLGATNFRMLKDRTNSRPVISILRRLVEVEAAVGVAVILVASSMSSQPPAIDLPNERATVGDIVARFTPRIPRLETPPIQSLTAPTPLSEEESRRFGLPLSFTPGQNYQPSSPGDIAWSEYNHNWAGICVFAIGVLGLIAQTPWGKWAKHWPLLFLGLGLFILIRADPENWPLGPRGFWESFQVPDVMQHRMAVVLVAAFAVFEWRVATGRSTRPWHALVFPAICMLGGALLFTHTHALGNIKEELLAEESHTPIAIFAIGAAGARWLQLRLPKAPAALAYVWPACFVMIGLMLTYYREA